MAAPRVDVHHHFVPLFYSKVLASAGGDPSGWAPPKWNLEEDIQFSDEESIAYSFLTLTSPGASVLPLDQQPAFCREANEYAAKLRSEYPKRFGFFACVPSLLDNDMAIKEMAYALDELHADGIILHARYGKGHHYLGHPAFAAIWDFLDSRGAVAFVHPIHPVDTITPNPLLTQPMIDYTHETTRTAVDLITSGTIRSHPNVKIILSHAGGTLPYLALRPAAMLPYVAGKDVNAANEYIDNFMDEARSFYFDTALSTAPLTLELLKGFAKPDHVLYGSDYPYAPTGAIKHMDRSLDGYRSTGDATFAQSINNGAALKLWPKLAEILPHP